MAEPGTILGGFVANLVDTQRTEKRQRDRDTIVETEVVLTTDRRCKYANSSAQSDNELPIPAHVHGAPLSR